MRDDFPSATKELLAKRVGYRCSNPSCLQLTSGPHKDVTKTVNVGVAAHITAASLGGPRYDASLSPAERSSAHNGIWLCQKCSKLIDTDVIRYSVNFLYEWKKTAEELAINEIESGHSHTKLPLTFNTSNDLFHKRLEACHILFSEVQKVSGVISKLFNTEELTVEDKQEIAFKVGFKIAELADKLSFYIEREIIVHIVGTFIGLENLFMLDNPHMQQNEIDDFNKNIRIAYKMLESIRDHGKLDKSIKSSITEYYNRLRAIQSQDDS
ncbi:hypothetical protein ACSQ6I_03230 [Anabaena sp. WFMT]|uniref:hypothetical protein n=1 Tax=Anabaena sp. WFMT TaxID=3449730 RepID=UPI003F276FD4